MLDGVKCNVAYAAEAEWMLVYAAEEGRDAGRSSSAGGRPASSVKEREKNMGLRAVPLYAVDLDGCRVPGLAEARRGRRAATWSRC